MLRQTKVGLPVIGQIARNFGDGRGAPHIHMGEERSFRSLRSTFMLAVNYRS